MVEPGHGPGHFGRLIAALINDTDVRAADRCEWDESQLAQEVAEHIRPLDPRASQHHQHGRLDRMLRRAMRVTQSRAPFGRPVPYGRSAPDASLRHYAACFGMYLPPRSEPDAGRARLVLGECLTRVSRRTRTREGIVHVFAPAPRDDEWGALKPVLRKLRSRGLGLRWSFLGKGVPAIARTSTQLESVVASAVLKREALAERSARRRLRGVGATIVNVTRVGRLGDVETGKAATERVA